MHVKRDPVSGDVWLGDVPMVDQGQKGYCVVASAERVMRYYGSKVDENELARSPIRTRIAAPCRGDAGALKNWEPG
jgi:hypothetical protein